MSKALTVTEELHACPDCGQAGFTAKGLKAHRGNKTCQSRALDAAKPMKEFDTARRHVESIRELGRRAAHTSILLGHELLRLKAELGIKRGGDMKSGSKPQTAVLIPWQQLVEQQTGLSIDTCDRCMQLAQAAKKHIPLLTANDVMKTPFSALPQARQTEVIRTLEKAADGQSMTQLMFQFGAWKEKKKAAPPKATKETAKKRTNNAADEALQVENLRTAAKEMVDNLGTYLAAFGECKQVLDLDELAAWENAADAIKAAAAAEIKRRKGQS